MKKTIIKIMIIMSAIALIAAGIVTVGAAGNRNIDANGDGICDNRRMHHARCEHHDANEDGICDNCAGTCKHKPADKPENKPEKPVCGENFTDADGDGVCDNRSEKGDHCGKEQGRGHCKGKGKGHGKHHSE